MTHPLSKISGYATACVRPPTIWDRSNRFLARPKICLRLILMIIRLCTTTTTSCTIYLRLRDWSYIGRNLVAMPEWPGPKSWHLYIRRQNATTMPDGVQCRSITRVLCALRRHGSVSCDCDLGLYCSAYRSTQPSTLRGTVKWVSVYELSNN